MHIADGVLSTPMAVATNVAAAAAVGMSLRRMDMERVPRVGVLAAVFFLASFVHVKLGPSSVHLMLNGLVGLLLGWMALPALAVALFLQAILLGYGGLTSLGANILVMGVPAVTAYALFGQPCRKAAGRGGSFAWGAMAGVTAVFGACLLAAGFLKASDPVGYRIAVRAIVAAHVPLAVLEAIVVGAAAGFLGRVRPDLLQAPLGGGEREGGGPP